MGLVNEIYELISHAEDLDRKIVLSTDEKILTLINNKIIVPITDEFLLYHKDSEKYEQAKYIDKIKKKKKEDTKIRYIVTKIDMVTDYYSQNVKTNKALKDKIDTYFSLPLRNRKAILVNDTEESKIISKLIKSDADLTTNEYYNDLMSYRQYPYINFKHFENYGFSLLLNKTVDAIRYISFQQRKKVPQMIIGYNERISNIVGFMIPRKDYPIQCVKMNQIHDIRKVGFKNKDKQINLDNGYKGILRFLKYHILKQKKYQLSVHWIFDPKKDIIKLDKYQQLDKITDEKQIKLTVSTLYDDILTLMHQFIVKTMHKMSSLSRYSLEKIMDHVGKQLFKFPIDSSLYLDILDRYYRDRYIKTEDRYDKKEDEHPGLLGKIITLSTYKPSTDIIKFKKLYIQQQITKPVEEEILEEIGAICQHNISWDRIMGIRRSNPAKFSDLIYNFLNQYATITVEEDYVCKSCGGLLDVKNYVNDGSFQDGKFVMYNSPINIPLENIIEYEKFKLTIRNLDKLIESFSIIANITYLIGTWTTQRIRRRSIVKNIIDLLQIHNANMESIYVTRSKKITEKYGVIKDLTQLFIFKLDNEIFIYAKGEKDFYKQIKRNNILIYVMLFVMLELSDSQIIYMKTDKLCNYYWFEKYGFNMFNNLKIIKNDKGDIVPIQNYKTLCYLIFFLSCLITKYNKWDTDSKIKGKKFNLLVQKNIIHTFVDIINSVLELNTRKKKHHIYNIVSTKIFHKLNSVFSDNNVIDILKKLNQKKIITDGQKKKFVTAKLIPINLPNEFQIGKYQGYRTLTKCQHAKTYVPKRVDVMEFYNSMNNVTNCIQGTFHNWRYKNRTFECTICSKTTDKIKYNEVDTKLSIKNHEMISFKRIADKYCKTGKLHKYVFDKKKKCSVCTKCRYTNINKLTNSEIVELGKMIEKVRSFGVIGDIKEKDDKIELSYINRLRSMYDKTKKHKNDTYNFIDNFINLIQSVIGKDVNINNQNIYVRYDTYIIDHDYNGLKLKKPLIIVNKKKKIGFRQNHPFFKTDVLFYTSFLKTEREVFYDAKRYLLLGFKERGKNFQQIKTDKYIKINYSIVNMLKMMGYNSKLIDIQDEKEYYEKIYKKSEDTVRQIVSDINRTRITELKKFMSDIIRYIYRIKFGYDEKKLETEDRIKTIDLVEKYKNQLAKMLIRKENVKAFRNWYIVKNYINHKLEKDRTINLDVKAKYYNYADLNKYDNSGNIILYYTVKEMSKLININSNKFIKSNLVYLLINLIIKSHNAINREYILTNFDIKRFKLILESPIFVYDYEKEGFGIESTSKGLYGEYVDPDDTITEDQKEQIDIDREESEALDFEHEEDMDYQIDYSSGINMS